MNPKIDDFLGKAQRWQAEMKQLRSICLDCGLTEELKWGLPCYSSEKKNIVIIQGFKNYCALLFFKGYLLKDPNGILVKTGPNTKVGRQARYTDINEIVKQASALKSCIREAIAIEKDGIKPPAPKKTAKKTGKSPAPKKAPKKALKKAAKKAVKKAAKKVAKKSATRR